MKFALVEEFTFNRRKCVIVKVEGADNTTSGHNGYVEVKNKKVQGYNTIAPWVEADELTFYGSLEHFGLPKDMFFVGFDSLHVWNDHKPESKTLDAVKKRTIALAKELPAVERAYEGYSGKKRTSIKAGNTRYA